jgi:hypothetical protein
VIDGLPEPLGVLARVAAVLTRLDVPYFVAGSLASSLHGEPRSTNDIDLVANLDARRAEALIADVGADFYVDPGAVREAVAERTSFNLVHLATATKVDVFLLTAEPFEVERMRARLRVALGGAPALEVFVDAPEHTDRGGRVSERQWRDAVGVLRVQGERLDQARLRRWAGSLGVTDLLDEALAEARER